MFNPNWPSQYTFCGRYEETGVTDRVVEYTEKTDKLDLKILDVGCSVGLAAKCMKEELLKFGVQTHVTGIDVEPRVQKEATKNLDKFILGDILQVELKPEFEIVICSKMLFFEGVKRKVSVLSKCAEVLKSDGGLVTDAHTYNFPSVYTQIKEDITDIKKILQKFRFGPRSTYEEIMKIKEFRFKRKVFLIVGKDEAKQYPDKVWTGWKNLSFDARIFLWFEPYFSRISAYLQKKPDYKKRIRRRHRKPN